MKSSPMSCISSKARVAGVIHWRKVKTNRTVAVAIHSDSPDACVFSLLTARWLLAAAVRSWVAFAFAVECRTLAKDAECQLPWAPLRHTTARRPRCTFLLLITVQPIERAYQQSTYNRPRSSSRLTPECASDAHPLSQFGAPHEEFKLMYR